MNTADFAAQMGVSEQIARRWFRSKRLPGVKRGPRGQWVITDPTAAAAAWAKNADHMKTSTAELERALASGRAGRPRAHAPAPALSLDPAVAAATDEMTTAFLIDLYAKLEALPGFDELEGIDQSALGEIFNCALVGWVTLGLPVDPTPWPPPHDPAYVAEANRD